MAEDETSATVTVAEIDAAIRAILTGGQSVSGDGMTYSAANLASLHKLRDQVQAEARQSKRPTARAFNMASMGY